jgi:alpha-1,3/alpha-1,6-mannosyltransferase
MSAQNPNGLRIAFLHPDLGIGGAERLVVDAAMALQQYGHVVHMFTSHHEEDHCFEETKMNGPLRVIVAGDWLPRTLFGKFAIICAILRGIWLSLFLLFNWTQHNPLIRYGNASYHDNKDLLGEYDIIITDILSVYNFPLLFTTSRTIFYCHYPDLLLSKAESNPILNILKFVYRLPVNMIETFTTGMADTILVNSEFTKKTFADTFKPLDLVGVKPTVLYPSILMASYDNNRLYDAKVLKWWDWKSSQPQSAPEPQILELTPGADVQPIEEIPREICVFVSINRFEVKKAVEQAIFGLITLKKNISQSPQTTGQLGFTNAKLIIAGGYDKLVSENVDYHLFLAQLAKENDLSTSLYPNTSGDVVFLLSFTQSQRTSLLRRAQAIIYTPKNEHFGIVPIETMYSSRSVIAHFSGGPLESIQHGLTGFLCNHVEFDPTNKSIRPALLNGTELPSSAPTDPNNYPPISQQFTIGSAMSLIYKDENNRALCINNRANQHVIAHFSIQVFAKMWNDVVLQTNQIPIQKTHWFRDFASNFGSSPIVRLVMLVNLAITVSFVMIYTLFRGKTVLG